MFPVFADVPGYPLVFVVFWGAAVIFLLAMARHLRVFASTRPAVEQPRPFGQIGARRPAEARSVVIRHPGALRF